MTANKTTIDAKPGAQDLWITREFDLPLEWLFKGFTTPEILEEWMGTKVLKLDCNSHGSYQFETTDDMGNKHRFNGTIHLFAINESIIRTFEMEQTNFPVQLEFLNFERLDKHTSRLSIHIIYQSVADRDNMLKLPFASGINMAHNRLQAAIDKLI